ncbi:hypothetical protein MMC22_004117 [Lobaria immixta]|nr:hypothetical protein [Lobaria immixta]
MARYTRYNRLNYHPALKTTFMSYSMRKGEPYLHIPVLQRVECHELVPPHGDILRRSHGLNPELSNAFFALPANENAYHEALALLQSHLRQSRDASERGDGGEAGKRGGRLAWGEGGEVQAYRSEGFN